MIEIEFYSFMFGGFSGAMAYWFIKNYWTRLIPFKKTKIIK